MTNLLALEAVKANKAISAIDISVMLGIGEKHGPAAVEWTLEKMVYAFTNKKRIQFDAVKGTRATYTFPFSDQYTLPSTLNIPKVITRLCFDSSVLTRVVATMRFLGITKLLKRKKVRGFFAELIDKSRVGTDTFAIKIDAHTDSGTVGLSFSGSNQSKLTANVTAIVALSLYENNVSTGVFNIEELFELVSLNDKKLMMRLKDTTIHYAIDS